MLRPARAGLGLVAVLALAGCGGEPEIVATNDCAVISAETDARRAEPVPVDSIALKAYGQLGSADLYRIWGPEMIGRINATRKAAVSAVAFAAECDHVLTADLWQLSVPPKSFKVDVVCANRRHFLVEDGPVPQPLESEQRKACRLKPEDVLAICESRLKRETRAEAVTYADKTVAMEDGVWNVSANAQLTIGGGQRNVLARCTVDGGGLIVNFSVPKA